MKKIVFALRNPGDIPGPLLEEAREKGCEILFSLRSLESSGEESLVVTDDQNVLFEAAARGCARLACETPDSRERLRGASYVIQGLKEVDLVFLERVYQRHLGIPWRICETERLSVRESVPEDFGALYEISRHPGMNDFLGEMTGEPEEERARFLSYIRNRYPFYEYGLWTLVETGTGRIIGRAGLEDREYGGRMVRELGYLIGVPWQNRGYGTEAAAGILTYARRVLEEEEVYLFIHPDNGPSRAVAGKLRKGEIPKGLRLSVILQRNGTRREHEPEDGIY